MIADTSGGCEPEFSLIWFKNVMDGEHLPYILDIFIETAKREGFWREGLLDKILANHGSARGLPEIPERWQKVFATAHDIAPEWHVCMQAAFQKHTDSGVSKTINMPDTATVDDVMAAYLMPFETFATVAKAGGMIQADLECVCRLISLALRYRIPMHEITRQLIGIQDGNPYGVGANRVLSLWDAIAKALASHHPPEQRQDSAAGDLAARPEGLPCPDCKSPLVHTENCEKCYGCGYSRW